MSPERLLLDRWCDRGQEIQVGLAHVNLIDLGDTHGRLLSLSRLSLQAALACHWST